jgi:hypothetical protein
VPNIQTLHNLAPPATQEEIRAAARGVADASSVDERVRPLARSGERHGTTENPSSAKSRSKANAVSIPRSRIS